MKNRIKIKVSCAPEIDSNHYKDEYKNIVTGVYSVVINVSDSPCLSFYLSKKNIPNYWFPIHESGNWGYCPFYGTAKAYDFFTETYPEKKILIHCHAGVNRSVSIAYAILKSEGFYDKEINEAIGDDSNGTFYENLNLGHIPKDIIPFLVSRKENQNHYLSGLLKSINSPNQRIPFKYEH